MKRTLSILTALVLMMLLCTTAFAYQIEETETPITIDGVVSHDEWGDPLESYYVTKGYESESDEYVTWEFSQGYQPDATFDAYFKFDSNYLYFAMVCQNIVPGNDMSIQDFERTWETDYWRKCCAWIGIAMYEDVMANPQTKDFVGAEESRNVWTKLYFSLLDDGNQAVSCDIVKGYWCTEEDAVGYTVLTADDYEITYNEPCLTYEARIPWEMITDEKVEAGDRIVTAVCCKMAQQAGADSGNCLMWGQGVVIDDLQTGGVAAKLVAAKNSNNNEEPEPTEKPNNGSAESTEPAPVDPNPTDNNTGSSLSTKDVVLYVVLGVIVIAIIAVVVVMFTGKKKKAE